MAKKYDVITMGSGLVDIFLDVDLAEKDKMLCFPIGTKIQVNNIDVSIGGGGANTSLSFSKLGLKTGFLGKIGDGHNSEIVLRELKKAGVDFLGARSKKHTGYSTVFESNKRNRTIFTYKGVSDELSFREIDIKKLNTKWFYFTSMRGESFESQKKIAEFAKSKGIKLAYNPSSYQIKQGLNNVIQILKNADVLTLNLEEAKMIVSKNNPFSELKKLGPKIVCITNGENEGGVYDGEFLYRFWPNKIKVKEVTGAGDAFGSSFVSGFIRTGDIEDSLRMAIANSESVIQKPGAHQGLLNWSEVQKEIRKDKFKIKREKL